MVAVEKNQPANIQNANEPERDAPNLSKLRSAVLNPSVQHSQFLAHGGSPDSFVIANTSTQKEY